MKHVYVLGAVWVRANVNPCLINLSEVESVFHKVSVILDNLPIDDPPLAFVVAKTCISLWLLDIKLSNSNLLFDFDSPLVVVAIKVLYGFGESLEFIVAILNFDSCLEWSHHLSELGCHPAELFGSLHFDGLAVAPKLF